MTAILESKIFLFCIIKQLISYYLLNIEKELRKAIEEHNFKKVYSETRRLTMQIADNNKTQRISICVYVYFYLRRSRQV